MARMTRSAVKQEPAPESPGTPMTLRQSSSRAQTISSSSTPTPDGQNMSSGSTTIPDHDVEMAEATAVPGGIAAKETAADGSPQSSDAQDVLTKLGSTSKDMIQAIQNLAALGLNTTLPPLPQFSIVGDQSAGKSSVIEALCNITLPRSEGTTTRCPFLITTTASSVDAAHQWTCTISLDHRYTYDPLACGPNVTFQQWRDRQVPDVQQIAVLHDKSKLEEELKKAQLKILNPSRDPKKNIAIGQKTQVAFSPNVVRLHIESPDLLDLSFYDLPGLITYNEEDEEDQAVVEFIEELARHYVNNPNGLVLFACSALQDLETNLALRLIKKAKANVRCIGVITKPDLVPSSDFNTSQIQAILRGEKVRLFGGWFVTRQSSRAEMAGGITYEEAREREQAFFQQPPWSTSPFAGRFGIPTLQVYIAEQLRNHIADKLPEIQQTLQAQMDYVLERLATFPEQDGHPIATVSAEIQQFAAMIKHELGDRSRAAFRRDYNGALGKFEEALKKNGPQIILKTPKPPAVISLDTDDEDGAAAAATPTPSRFATPGSSRKRGAPTSSMPPSTGKRVKTESGNPTMPPRPRFTLDFVKNEYKEGCASGIPGERQPEVTDRLSLAAIKRWNPLVTTLLEEIEAGVKSFIAQGIAQVLAAREQTGLFRAILHATNQLATETLRQQAARIMFSLAAEQHATWTSDAMAHLRSEFEQKLHEARTRARVNEFFDAKEDATGNVVGRSERDAKCADTKWLGNNLAPDFWREEVEALIKPLAYYQLACRRFQETIKSGLEFGFVHELCTGLAERLRRDLRADDLERCGELLLERPERERERLALGDEQARLQTAMDELEALSGVHA